MKPYWLLPSIAGLLMAISPASASEVVSWRFDAARKQLEFSTDSRVQPQAQMLADPSKLVISLPETSLQQPTIRQAVGQRGFRELRIGYNPDTRITNVVFELQPGYTIDPQQVLIKASSANNWTVQLPNAQIARGGLPTGKVTVFDESGGVVVANRQITTTVVASATTAEPSLPTAPQLAAGVPATISAVEVDRQYNRIIIRGSRQLTYTGGWDSRTSSYRITIPNARLANNLKLPVQNHVDLRVYSSGDNSVQMDVRRFDGYPIGPLVQYYGGQILSLTYGSAARPVIAAPNRPPVALTIPVARPIASLPTRPIASLPTRPTTNSKVLVMIDPGHGGKDPGAIGLGGLREVDVILPIAKRVADILESQGIRTKLTRDSDYFVGLNERVVMSNRYNATVFVSIHANSIDGRPDVNGLETYYYGSEGGKLAAVVHRNVLSTVTKKGFYLGDRRTRSARFLVLRKSQIPAILVETGYLTNESEVARLRRDDYRTVQAEGIAQGILEYLRN